MVEQSALCSHSRIDDEFEVPNDELEVDDEHCPRRRWR